MRRKKQRSTDSGVVLQEFTLPRVLAGHSIFAVGEIHQTLQQLTPSIINLARPSFDPAVRAGFHQGVDYFAVLLHSRDACQNLLLAATIHLEEFRMRAPYHPHPRPPPCLDSRHAIFKDKAFIGPDLIFHALGADLGVERLQR